MGGVQVATMEVDPQTTASELINTISRVFLVLPNGRKLNHWSIAIEMLPSFLMWNAAADRKFSTKHVAPTK